MQYLCYGGPKHNKIVDIPPGAGSLYVMKLPKRPVALLRDPYPIDQIPETITYTVQVISNGWLVARVLVCDNKKYDPEKILRTAVRRKVAQDYLSMYNR